MTKIASSAFANCKKLTKLVVNGKLSSVAKNASMMDYRKATGVEALVGYLYLAGDMDRIIELIGIGFDLNKKEETGEEHES